MKTKLLCIAIIGAFTFNINAQTLPNAGFETWNDMGTYEDPDNWITLNSLGGFGIPTTVFKSTDANSGSYACEIKSVSSGFGPIGGFISSGTGDIFAGTFNVPNTARPDKMLAYYKYAPAGIDTAQIAVTFTMWDNVAGQQVTVGEGAVNIVGTTSTYTLADITITYFTSDTPDTMMVQASSSLNVPLDGSTLLIDDISFETAGIQETAIYASQVYPNPSSEFIQIRLENTKANSIEILDLSGRTLSEIEIKNLNSKVSVSELSNGNYIYLLKNNGVIVSRGKFSIAK